MGHIQFSSVQFISVAQSCLTLWDPMNRSTPGLPVHHQLLQFTQTHVHWVSDTIQPSNPLSSPSPPALNVSQHQSLFQWVNSSHEVAKVLEFQLQHHSFQRTPRADLLQNGLVGSPCSPRDSQVFSNTTVQKHQFFGAQLSSQSNSHIHIVIHTVKGFGIVNKAEIDVFLELSCFFYDPADVCNLISDLSAFSKTSLNIWKFTIHVLLKPGLENFEHYFTSMWDECNWALVWAFFGIAFLWDWNENWPFPVLWPLLSFPNLLVYWV